jgi:hypothetical protein
MPKREYAIRASAPSKFSLRDLSHCTRIVRTGDAVDPDSAAVELPSNVRLNDCLSTLPIAAFEVVRELPNFARFLESDRTSQSHDSLRSAQDVATRFPQVPV